MEVDSKATEEVDLNVKTKLITNCMHGIKERICNILGFIQGNFQSLVEFCWDHL